ncbi:hypothetical protein DRQ33_03275 [bacterium]|nr:MAG: hypothetical protein DRQ33_03275 [bacterium]
MNNRIVSEVGFKDFADKVFRLRRLVKKGNKNNNINEASIVFLFAQQITKEKRKAQNEHLKGYLDFFLFKVLK